MTDEKLIKKYNDIIPKDNAHNIAVVLCAYLEGNKLMTEEEIKDAIKFLN